MRAAVGVMMTQPAKCSALALLLLAAVCLVQLGSAFYADYSQAPLDSLVPFGPSDLPPVTNWLLTPGTRGVNGVPEAQRQAWRKLGTVYLPALIMLSQCEVPLGGGSEQLSC